MNLAYEVLGRRASNPRAAGHGALTFLDERDADGARPQRWTYAEAWERVQRTAAGLRARGLGPGERVTVCLDHGPDYAFAFFGAIAAGLVPTPASPQLTEGELRFILSDTEAAALIAPPERAPAGGSASPANTPQTITPADLARMWAHDAPPGDAAVHDSDPEEPAYLIYTSGTGASPKGVLHAHRSLVGRRPMHSAWQGIGADDVMLHAGTLNWSYTLGVGLMDPWSVGAHAVLAAGVGSEAWPRLIAEHGVTMFAAVPTVYRQMLKYGKPESLAASALRHGLCAGEALPPAVWQEWTERTGLPLYEALGMTEVSTYISSGPATPVRVGSPGRPQPGRRIAVLPDGEAEDAAAPLPAGEVGLLAVHRSDPGLMLGYWRRPQEEAGVLRGEWFTGGDLASFDRDGYLWFHGRADDLIKSFGYRLSPVEIESALGSCSGVREVAVVAHPVAEGKTLVAACVVPEPGHAAGLPERLTAHAERHLAAYKRPHEVLVVDALPRTGNGKVQRAALRALLSADS